MARGFDDFVELDDAGVAYEFEDVYLTWDSFYVGYVYDFLFDKYFDGYFFSSEGVSG